MTRKSKNIPEAELAIMKLLWQRKGPMTAREIREQLYPTGTPSDHATVQKLLQRLESKKLLQRDRSGHVHQFTAIVAEVEIVGEQLRALAESIIDGSMVPVLTHFIRLQQLTLEERQQLKRLLDETAAPPTNAPKTESGVLP